MNRFFTFIVCVNIFYNLGHVKANPLLSLDKFATKREISVLIESPLQAFEMPEDVFKTVLSANLYDLRVFNGDNMTVPFELNSVKKSSYRSLTRSVPLVFFPIKAGASEAQTGEDEITISEDKQGRIISVKLGAKSEKENFGNHYLVDLRKSGERISSLKMEWKSSEPTVEVEVQSSSDLKRWSRVCSGVLANLEYEGNVIRQDKLECSGTSKGYLKIATVGNTQFSVEKVSAIIDSAEVVDISMPKLNSVTGSVDNEYKAILFDTGGYFPIKEINLSYSGKNYLAKIVVSSKGRADVNWIKRFSGNVYKLNIKGTEFKNDFIPMPTSIKDPLWKVESTNEEAVPASLPRFEFKWESYQVLFLAQGDGPFSLAYGSGLVKNAFPRTSEVSSLASKLGIQSVRAELGEPQQLAGASALQLPKVEKITDWKKYALWAALAFVVIVVLGMVRQLVKELKRGSTSS